MIAAAAPLTASSALSPAHAVSSRRVAPAFPAAHPLRAFSAVAAAAAAAAAHGYSAAGYHGTTILAVRRDGQVCMIGDGQVSLGQTVLKPNARKVRRLGGNAGVVAGFSGATADALTLFERLEMKLEEHPGQLLRASVNLAKDWRQDKALRRLDALLLVADKDTTLTLTGTGDVLEPADGVMGIGSGGSYAIAAARALMQVDGMSAEATARRAMEIAADICVFTNREFTVEVLEASGERGASAAPRPSESNAGARRKRDGAGAADGGGRRQRRNGDRDHDDDDDDDDDNDNDKRDGDGDSEQNDNDDNER